MPDPAILLNPADSASDPTLQQKNLIPDERGGSNQDPYALAEHPLGPIVAIWRNKLGLAAKYKEQQFGKWAKEGMRFLVGPYDFLYDREYAKNNPFFKINSDSDESDPPAPYFQMSLNLVAEMVDIFGPILYHRNPDRKVSPRDVDMPAVGIMTEGMSDDPALQEQMLQEEQAMQQSVEQQDARDAAIAGMLQWYLNYTPNKLGLKKHGRRAIDECIVLGMGCLWTELYTPKGANFKLVGSFFDSVNNLLVDPDAESIEDAMWISRTCVHPVWKVERDYGFKPGTLRANMESYSQQATMAADPDGDWKRKTGQTADLIRYTKIWSKMGIGGRLKDAPEELKRTLEMFGDYCYIVVAEGIPFPLNFGPDAQSQPLDMDQQTPFDWPTPFWVADSWPFVPVIFHEIPGQVWPRSILRSALGELVFLNWCFSFLAAKVSITCRDFLAIKTAAGEEMKNTILHGKDLSLIQMDQATGGSITDIVQFLQHPPINGDIYRLIEIVMHNFEKRTGLSELMYGMSATQMRSAEEASLKGNQLQIRPDDMTAKVEEAMSEVALNEAIAISWHLKREDIEPVMGKANALYWERLVSTKSLSELAHSLQYRIEAGSAKKPNKERDAQNISQAMQNLLQPFFEAAASGQVDPFNHLLADWCKSVGLDPKGYMLQPPPPQQGPSEAELKAQESEQELQQSAQQHEQTMQQKGEEHQFKMAQAQQEMQMDLQKVAVESQAEDARLQGEAQRTAVANALEMAQGAATHRQKIRHTEQSHESKLTQSGEAHKAKLAQAKAAAKAKPKANGKSNGKK